ncbi:MAG: hypothetical protein ACLFQO_15035 [Cyclobacteriaceae bacterium]
MQFLDRTHEFHEKMRLYFYPKIFENAPVEEENWEQFRPEYFSAQPEIRWAEMLLPLLLISAVITLLAAFNLRKLKSC